MAASTLTREPALVRGAITAALAAIIHLLIVFGVPIPDEVANGIASAADALVALAGLVWIRSGVTPASDPAVPVASAPAGAPADPH